MLTSIRRFHKILLLVIVALFAAFSHVPYATHTHIDETGKTSHHSHDSEKSTSACEKLSTKTVCNSGKRQHENLRIKNTPYWILLGKDKSKFFSQYKTSDRSNFILRQVFLEQLSTIRMTI